MKIQTLTLLTIFLITPKLCNHITPKKTNSNTPTRKLVENGEIEELDGLPEDTDVLNYDMMDNKPSEEITVTIKYISEYSRLMLIGSSINKFYNNVIKIIPHEEREEMYESKSALEEFELSKTMVDVILNEKDELEAEVNDLYKNVDHLVMSTNECLELYDLLDYYHFVLRDIDQSTEDFDNKKNNLDFLVDNMNVKMKEFLGAIESFRYFNRFLLFLANPFKSEYNMADNLDGLGKIEQGIQMVTNIIGMKDKIIKLFDNLEHSINAGSTYRHRLFEAINNFKIDPLTIEGLSENIYVITAWFMTFLVIFV